MISFLLSTDQTNECNDVDDDDGTADDDEDPNHLPLVQPTQASENGFVSWNRTWSGQQRLNGRSHRLMFWHFLVFPMCLVFSFSLENNAILSTRKIMWWYDSFSNKMFPVLRFNVVCDSHLALVAWGRPTLHFQFSIVFCFQVENQVSNHFPSKTTAHDKWVWHAKCTWSSF